MKLRAEFANPEHLLWPGQLVSVSLTLGIDRNAIVLPDRAVQNGPDGTYVFVVKSDQHAEQRKVSVKRMVENNGRHRQRARRRRDGRTRRPVARGKQFGPEGDGSGAVNVSEIFVRRPVMTTLVMVGVLVFGIVGYRQLPVASLPNVDFPTISVSASLPGASPETMASAVATPLEKQFSTIPSVDSMTSTSSLGSTLDHAAVHARSQYRRRRAGRAGRDLRGAAPAAAADDDAADVPQGESGGFADLLYRDSLRRRCAYRHSTNSPRTRSRSASRRCAASRRSTSTARRSTRCASISIRMRCPAAGLGIDTVANAIGKGNVNLPTGTLYGPNRIYNVNVNGQLMDAAAFGDMIVTYQNGAPVRLKDIANVYDGIQNDKGGATINGETGVVLAVQKQPGTNTIQVVEDIKATLPAFERSLPAGADLHVIYDRSQSIRESVSDVKFSLLLALGAGRHGHLRVPAQRFGDDHSVARAADVDRRHVRGDVCARLQHRQSFADGSDAVGRLRRRRCDRDAREHRAPHGNGQGPAHRDVRRRARNWLYDRVDDAVARGRVHPGRVHGRHHRPPAQRIRGDDRQRRAGLGLRFPEPDADAVQPHAEVRARAAARAHLCVQRAHVQRRAGFLPAHVERLRAASAHRADRFSRARRRDGLSRR